MSFEVFVTLDLVPLIALYFTMLCKSAFCHDYRQRGSSTIEDSRMLLS